MALFESQVAGPTGSAVSPQSPSQEPSSVMNGLSLAQNLMPTQRQIQAHQAQQAEKQRVASTTEFTQGQLAIADAVSAGRMSSSEGRRRMRVNYSRALASNPGAIDDLTKAQKNIMSTSGMGQVVQEGTEEEQRFAALRDEATSSGWVPLGASEEEARAGVERYTAYQKSLDTLKQAQAELTYQRGQIGLQSDRVGLARAKIGLSTDRMQHETAALNLQEKRQQKQVRDAMTGLASNYTYKFRQDAQDLARRVENNEITREEASRALDRQWETVNQVISQAGAGAGGSYVSNLSKPMEMVYNNMKKQISGELDNEIAQNRIDKAITMSQEDLLSDPKMQKTIAANKLLPNADLSTLSTVAAGVSKFIGGDGSNSTSTPANYMDDDPDEQDNIQQGLQILKDNMTALNAGVADDPEATEQQLDNTLNKMLQSIDSYGYATENPEQYNKVVDFLASSEYGKYASGKGPSFNREAADGATLMVKQQYEKEALRLVKEEWQEAQTNISPLPESGVLGTTGDNRETSKLIEPTFSGGGVVFRARGNNNPRIAAKVKDLNRRVSPVVNRLIRMSAHLEGDTNYKAQWDQTYSQNFSNGEEQGTED